MPPTFPHHHAFSHPHARPGRETNPAAPPKLAIVGTFIDTHTQDGTQLRVRHDSVVVVDTGTGRIESILPHAISPPCPTSMEIVDLRGDKCSVFVPGFVDCHIHAPQYSQLGTKTDVPLMDWLNKWTFPAESRFSSPQHARTVYSRLVRRLLRNGTTTAVYFGSNHLEASLVLAELCAAYGQRALVGKTCSDQLVPDGYVETTQGSLADTEAFIVRVRQLGRERGALVQPVITPRFVPTCSRELLCGLGRLALKYGCHVQTHAAESAEQVALVREQNPDLKRDIPILSSVGLLTPKTILAHCTHLYDSEAATLAAAGTSIASCPCSNMMFARAILPVRRFAAMGVGIGLGTDIAGGWSASMLDSARLAALVSCVHAFQPLPDRAAGLAHQHEAARETVDKAEGAGETVDNAEGVGEGAAAAGAEPAAEAESQGAQGGGEERIDYKTAFHLATRGGAAALGLDVGVFDVGMKWDAVQVSLGWDDDYGDDGDCEQEGEDVETMFERWVCGHGGEHSVARVWVDGKVVFCR